MCFMAALQVLHSIPLRCGTPQTPCNISFSSSGVIFIPRGKFILWWWARRLLWNSNKPKVSGIHPSVYKHKRRQSHDSRKLEIAHLSLPSPTMQSLSHLPLPVTPPLGENSSGAAFPDSVAYITERDYIPLRCTVVDCAESTSPFKRMRCAPAS